ncbi:hypothetical protein F5B21DRAFT_496253 [Xylaria acuta]|nr:hypothetical protein F5B21DRAFT_496253 [Xylaria acuta]
MIVGNLITCCPISTSLTILWLTRAYIAASLQRLAKGRCCHDADRMLHAQRRSQYMVRITCSKDPGINEDLI